jgi:four helix bundle protein
MVESYKELIVWQKAMDLVLKVYELVSKFPKEETYGLSSQIKRAVISIPSNITEGRNRGTRKDFINFLRIAYGSGAELETQLELSKRLFNLQSKSYSGVNELLIQIMKMLNKMISKLQANS